MPIFIGQGLADQLVAPAATREFVAGLCAHAEDVSFFQFAGVNHAFAAYASLPDSRLELLNGTCARRHSCSGSTGVDQPGSRPS